MYQSEDQSQIITLMEQLQKMKFLKGRLVEEYIKKAREMKNQLVGIVEKLGDKSMTQLLLNGLSKNYDSII
jgi:hypothetical protein